MTDTEARANLGKLLKERVSIRDGLNHATEQTKAVHASDRAVTAARRRLSELVGLENAAVTAWSNGETDAPVFDAKARHTIEAQLKSAIDKAAEVRASTAPFMEALSRLNDRRRQNDRDVELAKLDVMVETIGPAIRQLEESASDFVRRRDEVIVSADFLAQWAREIGRLDTSSPDMALARPILAAVEKINERMNSAMARFDRGIFPVHKNDRRWSEFAAALGRSASANLDAA